MGAPTVHVERRAGDERGAREVERRLRRIRNFPDPLERMDRGQGVRILDERRAEAKKRSRSSTVLSRNGFTPKMPALLTSTSIPPSCSRAVAAMARAVAGLPT